MKTLLTSLALLVAVAGCQCGGAAPVVKNPRPAARAAVDVAKDAWVVVADACVAAAEEANDDSIRAKCAKVLKPAHDMIVDAAEAVDTNWNAGAACALSNAMKLVDQAASGLSLFARPTQAVVADALAVAQDLAGAGCGSSDAGVE
jgi:hypothetical protein